MLCSLTRLPNIGVPSLPAEAARHYGLNLALLLEDKGKRLDAPAEALAQSARRVLVTRADALEAIEQLCRTLYRELQRTDFSADSIEHVVQECLGEGVAAAGASVAAVLKFACSELVPNLGRTTDEIGNLLRGARWALRSRRDPVVRQHVGWRISCRLVATSIR